MSEPSSSERTLTKVRVSTIRPNLYNPNRKSPEEYEQQKMEARRLGRLTKPLVIRPRSEVEDASAEAEQTDICPAVTGKTIPADWDPDDWEYEAVDGEHGWWIAIDLSWMWVDCEIVRVGNFEAMRQTLIRNRGGTDNPVLLGRIYRQMMKERGMSIRKLARELEISDGTIRNDLDYLKAYELRSKCAGPHCLDEIGDLNHRQVRAYLDLPDGLRDKWLDAGAFLKQLDKKEVCEGGPPEIRALLTESGLSYVVEPTLRGFQRSLKFAIDLSRWRQSHRALPDVDSYIKALADVRIGMSEQLPPSDLLNVLPCVIRKDVAKVLVSAKKWAAILKDVASRTQTPKAFLAMVETAVRTCLRKAGVDPGDAFGPNVAEALQIVQEAPDFVRDAQFLTLGEKVQLATVTADASDEIVLSAKQMTVEHFQRKRMIAGTEGDENSRRGASLGRTVDKVFQNNVAELVRAKREAAEDDLFVDHDRLRTAVLGRLAICSVVHDGVVGDRPAKDVLAERLRSLGHAELVLLAAALLKVNDVDSAGRRWLKAEGGCTASDSHQADKKKS